MNDNFPGYDPSMTSFPDPSSTFTPDPTPTYVPDPASTYTPDPSMTPGPDPSQFATFPPDSFLFTPDPSAYTPDPSTYPPDPTTYGPDPTVDSFGLGTNHSIPDLSVLGPDTTLGAFDFATLDTDSDVIPPDSSILGPDQATSGWALSPDSIPVAANLMFSFAVPESAAQFGQYFDGATTHVTLDGQDILEFGGNIVVGISYQNIGGTPTLTIDLPRPITEHEHNVAEAFYNSTPPGMDFRLREHADGTLQNPTPDGGVTPGASQTPLYAPAGQDSNAHNVVSMQTAAHAQMFGTTQADWNAISNYASALSSQPPPSPQPEWHFPPVEVPGCIPIPGVANADTSRQSPVVKPYVPPSEGTIIVRVDGVDFLMTEDQYDLVSAPAFKAQARDIFNGLGGALGAVGAALGRRTAANNATSSGPQANGQPRSAARMQDKPRDIPPPVKPKMLYVGAENYLEFANAYELEKRGVDVTVANPKQTEAAKAFQSQGGKFIPIQVQDVPGTFDYVHETFPQPLGRTLEAITRYSANLAKVAPGGRLTIITENQELAGIYNDLAKQQGLSFSQTKMTAQLPSTEYLSSAEPRYLLTMTRPK